VCAFQYVSIAVSLAADIPALQNLRAGLRPAMLASPVCDGRTFVANLAATYERLWDRYVRVRSRRGAKQSSEKQLKTNRLPTALTLFLKNSPVTPSFRV